ncbi:hypothetical protein KGF57_002395 [Candida theae]|uniref:Uncharacterized protein n=1 Tax=Candida theae TaxID=1198502 RepID=A0AAD5BEY1_9ASCO|nr:uncharacterized protein KGF57_002395 [Candida theae]KAI5958550.1 hypothetical protein KGF57_002395 [Candida theae]
MIKSVPAFKESRLNSLYSNFQKNKQLNPEGYQANIQAWKSLFTTLIKSDQFEPESSISIPTYHPSLKESLSLHPYNEPKNLDNILQEFVNDRFLIPASLYSAAKENYLVTISGHFRLYQYLSVNAWQQWRALKSYSVMKQGRLVDERFIHWDELVRIGQKVATVIETKIRGDTCSSILFNYNLLFDELSKYITVTKVDYDLLLKYLSRDVGLLQTKTIDEVLYIKISQEGFIPEDEAIVQMKQTIKNLETRIKEIETKLSAIDFKSVLCLPKEAQKSSLRQKMATKTNLVKLLNRNMSLELEMTTLLQKIDDSSFNLGYFSVLENSARALSKINSKLKVDDVDRVKADIDEEISKEQEISDALAGGANDEDVDNELNRMIEEEEKGDKLEPVSQEESAEKENGNENKDGELLNKLENLTVKDDIKKSPQESPAKVAALE